MIDVTKQTLQKRSGNLNQFSYIVFHDFTASLRAISNLSEWLETDLNGQLPLENHLQLQILRQRVKGMFAMINNLQSYLCIEHEKLPLKTIDVGELLVDIINTFDPPLIAKVKIDPEMPTLTAKQMLLSQVFTSLIGNRAKHCDSPEDYIQISVQEQGRFYEFAITHHEPSAALEKYDTIPTGFQTFETDGMFGIDLAFGTDGTIGVDLAIVQKIIEAEEGSIWVESRLAMGTTIYFTWPKS